MATMNLGAKKCKPCEGGMPPLDENEIAEYLDHISGDWKVQGTEKISKEYAFVSYRHTIDFVNKVAQLAEEEGHHPVMHVYFGKVIMEYWTHAINGLSENDFIMAYKTDQLL
jgi:4a-hydroxytetrahydrobiopterin dehydratase